MAVWNLEDIYPDGGRPSLIRRLNAEVNGFRKVRSRLGEKLSCRDFICILEAEERISDLAGRLSAKAGLLVSEDTSDARRIAEETSVSRLCAEADNLTMFFGLWFRGLPDEAAARYMKASGKYRYLLERNRAFRDHTLKEDEERIINLKDLTGVESAVRFYDMIAGRYRFKFAGRGRSYDEISEYKLSPRRQERKAAYDITLRRFGEDEAVLGEIYRSIVNDVRNEAVDLRHFRSPLSAANLGNDVPDRAVDALLSAVRENRGLFQGYFRLKAKLCGIDDMDRYDVYAPYHSRERRYGYGECVREVLDTFRDFDESAYLMAKRVFDEGHVHSEPGPRKQPGAFCHSVVLGVTPYLMLNHTGKLNDLFTMMHEVGHGVHTMAARGQTQLTYHAGLPLAETASVFGEMLLSQRLLDEARDEEKVASLVRSLDRQYATVARQAYFTLFEIDAHKAVAEGASTDEVNRLYMRNLREQFGGGMAVPDVFMHEWLTIQHIYYSPFYCYTYALANMVVLALWGMYRDQGFKFAPKYMHILSLGGSDSPKRILSEAGLDINRRGFWQRGFDAIGEEIKALKRLTC